MKRFKTVAIANIFNGVVELTREQARIREQSLRHLEGDCYEVAGPIQFKVGEILGYEGPVNKALGEILTPISSEAEVPEASKAPKLRRRRPGSADK